MLQTQTLESTTDTQIGKSLIARLQGLTNGLFGEPQAIQSSVWYAGLVIEPTEFSQQLGRLQVSLHKAALQNGAQPVPQLR